MGRRPRTNHVEEAMARSLDQLAEFQEFTDDVLPLLRRAITEKWTKEQIESDPRIQALLVARQMTIGLTDKDPKAALAAIRDIRDRKDGKPVERKEIRTKIEEADDDAIDARLKTLLGAQKGSESDPIEH